MTILMYIAAAIVGPLILCWINSNTYYPGEAKQPVDDAERERAIRDHKRVNVD